MNSKPPFVSIDLVTWNVEGLSSSLAEPGFVQYLYSFDICCLIETFTSDDFDFSIYFSKYSIFHSPAIKLSKRGRRSGGVLILVKKSFSYVVSSIPCTHDNMIVLKISCSFKEDIILVCLYVPPTDSPYYKDKLVKCNLELLQDMLLDLEIAYPRTTILITGDLNARTGNWNLHKDYDPEYTEFNDCFCPNYTSSRHSHDTFVNQFGEILIDLCRSHHIYIENGCNKGDEYGKFTYVSKHGESVIDYCLVSCGCTQFDMLFAVGTRVEGSHMPLEMHIKKAQKVVNENIPSVISKIIWDSAKAEEVLANIRSDSFKASLDRASSILNLCIDSSVRLFTLTLLQTANIMRRSYSRTHQINDNHSRWYDIECRLAKRKSKNALLTFNKSLSPTAKSIYVQYRNSYKKLLREKKNIYHDKVQKELLLHFNDSDKFWNMIRRYRNRPQAAEISLETWELHFKTLFKHNKDYIVHLSVNHNKLMRQDEMLDADFTSLEVELALNKVSSSKASGPDGIPGALIKFGAKYLITYLTKLFNSIYDVQKFPRDWSQSIIVPIHKSGCTSDPQNYRGISLLNILSKVFSSIITKRLHNWCEENQKLCIEQAGFRRDHSTIDHIFTLHAIITNAIYGKGRGKMYVAFVDYSKAFDSVIRPCLWDILSSAGVSTKFLNMLKAMYDNVQACVRWNGSTTSFFECPNGTKQGAKESPILFSLYINFVADLIRQKGKHGVQMQSGKDEVFFLIFADDIALLSTTPSGLQNQITNLHDASKLIGLEVNKSKTKVMVFRRGGFLAQGEKWFLDGSQLEVVNAFKYLGYTFTTKLSETIPLVNIASKAKMKTVSLLKTLRDIHTSKPKVFFKLFDAQIQPSLLYASELWGLNDHICVERSHLFACKRFLNVDVKACSSLVYGETGRFPLVINSTIRAVKYWLKILKMPDHRLPKQALSMLACAPIPNDFNWLKSIELCLCKSGYGFVWYNKGVANENSFLKKLKTTLQDCFLQGLDSTFSASNWFSLYRSFKHDFGCENYLHTLDISKFRIALTRFRLRRNELRNNSFTTIDKNCPFCRDCIEDEIHFLLNCDMYIELRRKYLDFYIKYMNSMGFTLSFLINGKGYVKTKKVAMFIHYAMKYRRQYVEKELVNDVT